MSNFPGSPITQANGTDANGVIYEKGNERNHRSYNSPDNETGEGVASNIGTQFNTFYWQKKALIELKKEMFFGQLADTTSMPKHMGKKIRKYHYLPLLDDRNGNDQGIDAAGMIVAVEASWDIYGDSSATPATRHFVAKMPVIPVADGGVAFTMDQVVAEFNERHPDGVWSSGANELVKATFAEQVTIGAGNMYGSSKDVGTIASKMPALSEHGGRVNRVGFKRMELEGSLEKFGFFDEYTQESMDFDTDSELMMHVNREMLRGANEMTEDALQIDLLNAAGVVRYAGIATEDLEIDDVSFVTYDDLQKLSRDLDDNRMPKNTKIITGSRMIDTRTIDGARYMYIGSELVITMRNMTDNFGNPAFIPVHQYGAATTPANGEIGSVGEFRLVVAPEMMHWQGAGAATTTETVYETGGMVDVFPMLCVGSGAFTTIGFQTDGKSTKFKIVHKKPGSAIADRNDPYGEIGFMSIKWYYGSMILRPEWIACVHTAALY